MIKRRDIVAVLAAGAAASLLAPAEAIERSPKDFLAAIYSTYQGKPGAAGVRLESDEIIRRYFEPMLAALMIKDFADAKKRGEPPALNGDPFVDAQDWDISGVNITVRAAGAGKAAGFVSFRNFGKPVRASVDLVRMKEGWRISEIRWSRGGSLRGIYRKR